MRILAGPLVGEEICEGVNSGWSGVVILYESHAAVHSYPILKEMFLDVFSCRVFDVETIVGLLRTEFESFEIVEQSEVNRGIHWSPNVGAELQRWSDQRSKP